MDESKELLMTDLQAQLEKFVQKVKLASHQIKTDDNLADGQIFLLFLLCRKDVCKASDIANEIGITSGAVTGMTDKLVNMGLIHRDRSEEDRRVVLLSLTGQGKEMVNKIKASRFERIS